MTIGETDQTGPDAPAPAPRKRRLPGWAWTLIGLAAVVAIVAALGGFREVPIAKLPAIALGETHEGDEYRTTVDAVYLTSQLPNTGYAAEEGFEYLVVEATVENTTDRPIFTLTRQLIRALVSGVVEPYGDAAAPDVSDPRFGGPVGYLQPNLPLTVLYSWDVEIGQIKDGDEAIIGIFERHYDPSNPAFDDYSTTDAVARVITEVGAGR